MDPYLQFPDPFLFFLVAVFGLCLGSFATALTYRLPRDLPWITSSSRSACPSCKHVLGARDLIPVFSWLFSKGSCRHCGEKISPRYPVTELTCMLLVIALYTAWQGAAPVFVLLCAVPFLLAAVLIDWEHMILPDDINISLGILSVLYVLVEWHWGGQGVPYLIDHFLSGFALVGIFACVSWGVGKWKGKQALGMGDIKFLAPAGIFLGIAALPTYLALSGLLGLASAALKGIGQGGKPFPFGPALIISLYIHLFLTGLGFDYTW